MPTRKLIFEVLFRIEKDEGEYHAFCPNLKGLHTSGRTEKEALENAKCAFEAYIASFLAHHDPIPLTMRLEEPEDKTPAARPFASCVEVAI
jgi:predicted RNase H-like HicB family nuclease